MPRHDLVNAFVASARDMGDPAAIAAAVRVWWAVNFPRTRPCRESDMALYRAWLEG